MGDRNNPIKFGPEWLRNLARERNAGASTPASNSQIGVGPGPGAAGGATAHASHSSATGNTSNTMPKVLLAKLRYGREEMLALYDRSAEAPPELIYNDTLYQPRGKPPIALNNTFEEDLREPVRSGPPLGGMASGGDRFAVGRGTTSRGSTAEGRGRGRLPFIRQTSVGRGQSWHANTPRMPGYSGGADDDVNSPLRPWSTNNAQQPNNRNAGDQADWQNQNKMFRTKRPGTVANTTNWRQTREDDEWRASESARPRSMQPDKWERDWGDRPAQDKGQSSTWNTHRRTWVGGDEENLPEWAMDNAEACGGTFDSSGAFHGYSNDDTNLPKSQEAPFPLTRSHTHGSFVRSKTAEEGSDEWWASEKAKKLSPKRFEKYDALEIKFKTATTPDDGGASSSATKPSSKDDPPPKALENQEALSTPTQEQADNATSLEKAFKKTVRFSESKTFDALMRQDINVSEGSDDRGNFQSVMINPNNSLRQKHQNMVQHQNILSSANRQSQNQKRKPISLAMQMLKTSVQKLNESDKQQQSPESKIVNDIMDMNLEDKKIKEMLSSLPQPSDNLLNPPSSGMSSVVTSRSQHRLSSPVTNPGLVASKGSMGASNSGLQSHSQPLGITNSALNASLGLPIGPSNDVVNRQLGIPLQGVPPPVLPGHGPSQTMGPGMQKSLGPNIAAQNMGMPGQSLGSGLSSQNMGPSLTGQNLGPHLSGPNMGSNLSGQNMGSSLSSQNMGPSLSSQGMGPSMTGQNMGQGMGPNLSGQGMGSNMSSQGMGSNMSSQGMGSNMTGQNMGSKMSGPNMGPNMSGQNMGPNLSGQNMGLNMSGQNMASKLSGQNMGHNQTMPGMMQGGSGISGFPPGSLTGLTSANLASSLFLGQPSSNNQNPPSGDIPMPGSQSNVFAIHGLQHSSSQSAFGSSIYSSMLPPPPPPPAPSAPNSQNAEMWYYEDPKQIVQGPFTSREMYHWYRAGFFTASLMVRRTTDSVMRPLGSYGPVVPFAEMDILSSYPGFEGNGQGGRDPLLNPQPGMGLDSMNMNAPETNPLESMPYGGLMRNPPFGQQPIDSLWGQPTPQPDMMWMQQAINARNESIYFWEQQPSAMATNSLRPEIPKEMKTEDEILAQLRASQANNTSQNLGFLNHPPLACSPGNMAAPPEEPFQQSNVNIVPDLDKLQKFMQEKPPLFAPNEPKVQQKEKEVKPTDLTQKNQQPMQKQEVGSKQVKPELEKAKTKETTPSKTKGNKKSKDDAADSKPIEDDANAKAEKRSTDASPAKTKKEEKINKKEAEKERKEWINEGFTIVKAQDKAISKENKKKQEELKLAEEMERKRKDEDRLAVDEEKKMKNLENLKKESQKRQQQSESVTRKAPWSAVSNQQAQEASKDGPTLAEIQRLEREKKLMQMKEQQQMMHIIAQQQAAALAREQEMQAGLGWNKKKTNMNVNMPGQSLAEIQAEARKQAAVAAAETAVATARAQAELQAAQSPAAQVPWVNSMNGASGFWESLAGPAEPPAAPEPKPKKKVQVTLPKKEQVTQPVKKEQATLPIKKHASPSADFETWCMTVLTSWNTKIDVPTFVGFLKDIESPYEVKDYVKCYLGETRDASDFARQFLERRSKLLRVGMVTPSDDLCSPALAVNPRTNSGSDYQEVKGKGKKVKKNKMLKVDARILGFSVTAAEDRINVGDIDMA